MNPSALRGAQPGLSWWCVAAGSLLGVSVLHPYSMAVNRMLLEDAAQDSIGDALRWSLHAFSPHMWPMSVFYAMLGAGVGLGFALLLERQRRVASHRLEVEKRLIVQQTLREVTLTVAHHVRNANAQVGGFGRRLLRSNDLDDPQRSDLEKMIRASDRIESVVAALCLLQDIDEKEDVGSTNLKMLDLKRVISEKAADLEK